MSDKVDLGKEKYFELLKSVKYIILKLMVT